jgi:hypothetical protein
MTPGWAEAVASQSSEAMLNILQNISGGSRQTRAEIERIQNEINELNSGMTIRPIGGGEAAIAESKKSWQEWFSEITKISHEQFGSSGARAAELYLGEFSRSFEAGKTVFTALGEEFNIAESLRSQQADIQKTLVELFSIDPADIDQGFAVIDQSIAPLIAQFRRLGEEIKAAEDAMKAAAGQKECAQKIEDLRRQIDEIGKSQSKLAMATFEATGATEDQIAVFKEMLDLRDELLQAEKLKETLKGIKDSLVNLGANSALSGIEELGHALSMGKEAGESMKNALAAMSQEILNALPNMFLQAGLQLISQGQWPLGLGFVAAAGSTALIKGYVGGKVEAEQSAARNAHGNIFGETGIQAFARGGSFTNQIVSEPTLFKFARGTGLMGEAGPEAVMPLKRMANGDLGIRSEGGGANVTVNIINNSGAEVKQEEYEDGDGNKQIDVIIGDLVNSHLGSGKADRVLSGRYGLRAAGV